MVSCDTKSLVKIIHHSIAPLKSAPVSIQTSHTPEIAHKNQAVPKLVTDPTSPQPSLRTTSFLGGNMEIRSMRVITRIHNKDSRLTFGVVAPVVTAYANHPSEAEF